MSYDKLKLSELCKWSTGRGRWKKLRHKMQGTKKECCDFESNESICVLFTELSVEPPPKKKDEEEGNKRKNLLIWNE